MGKIYAIGDIHGCYSTLRKLIEEKLSFNLHDSLIILGDIINKGPNSKKTLDYIFDLSASGYKIRCLKGNHEKKLIMAYGNGLEFFQEFLEEYRSLDLLVYNIEDYLDRIADMEIYIELDRNILSHLGFNDIIRNPYTDTRSLFTNSEIELELDGKRQITGHHTLSLDQIKRSIDEESKIISLDGGCVYGANSQYGYLCCLELRSQQLFYQKNIERNNY